GAFHTALMAPAAEEMRAELAAAKIGCVGFDVIANVSASPVREPDEIRAALERQMTSPVRFEQSVRELISRGADTFVEIGPGGVLTGLVRRISGDVAAVSCGTMEEIGAFVGGARRSSGAG
ncbi:MAG: malonyl CoA-acyl carrier protein transacylase, partial [Planctomycetota bacterium]|nr:malonyl CoA-acyl carrier protein transacylase [Planctomycetota bacterium]